MQPNISDLRLALNIRLSFLKIERQPFSKFVSFDNSSPYHHVSRQVLKEAAHCAVTRDGFLAWYEKRAGGRS